MPSFASTHWSLVLEAGHKSSPQARRALEDLCRQYWQPVYAFIRRRGAKEHDAQDLTQGFFARLLEKGDLAVANPQRGRFRSFLLTAVKNFLVNAWDKAQAQKRGGGQSILSFDFAGTESRFSLEPSHDLTPEKAFDRHWAVALLDAVMVKLRDEYATAKKLTLFQHLKAFLTDPTGQSLTSIGHALNMSPGAVKTAAYRLRKRYRDLLKGEVAQTLTEGEDVEDEIRGLFAALGG